MTARPSRSVRGAPPVIVDQVAARAREVLDSLFQCGELDRDALCDDPMTELDGWSQVAVRVLHDDRDLSASVNRTPGTGGCSVAGTYYAAAAGHLPTLAVVRSHSAARDAFTVLHELGHHLQRTDDDLIDALGDLDPELSVLVEDAVCDRLASSVLIPDQTAERVIGARGPTAAEVVELHSRTSASRAAVCVRAAQHLQGPGHVVLLDEEDRVQFASSRLLFPLRRGSDQGTASVVRRARSQMAGGGAGRVIDGDTRFSYRDGAFAGDSLYAQSAAFDNGYLVVVAVLEKPPWEHSFVMPKAQLGPQTRWHTCERAGCGHEFQAWDGPHELCGVPKCPECGFCACTPGKVAERDCPNCFQTHPEAMFDNGARLCRDCD